MKTNRPNTLAWHETLELHELVAFQYKGIIKLKKAYRQITELRGIYGRAIQGLTSNINELMQFYHAAPGFDNRNELRNNLAFYTFAWFF